MNNLTKGLTLGILGGGQLGRMSALAASRLGISVIILCPEENSPASHVALETIIAPYDDKYALKEFSDKVDVVSYEFENIPVETIEYLESLRSNSVFPDKNLLQVSQDRIKEKTFINRSNIKTARWKQVANLEEIQATANEWNADTFILKTTRDGYDGKGQGKFDTNDIDNISEFLNETKKYELIMEEMINFQCEISIIIGRDKSGKTETYGPMLNEHKNHILHTTTIPSGVTKNVEDKAIKIANTIASAVNLIGVLTVELFVCDDEIILVNEIAPRTHNSGHWSIDACAVSQFENHVRTVCGLPIGPTGRHSDAQMLNLIGHDIDDIEKYIKQPNTCVHLYGKREARVGRKMGHVNFIKPLPKS